jgi:hypothetical protein
MPVNLAVRAGARAQHESLLSGQVLVHFPSGQRPPIHLLSLSQLALATIQAPEIVDGGEGRNVVRSWRLLPPG